MEPGLARAVYNFHYKDEKPKLGKPAKSIIIKVCGGGGTGRRKGLKIPCPVRDVRVRFPPSAPVFWLELQIHVASQFGGKLRRWVMIWVKVSRSVAPRYRGFPRSGLHVFPSW